MPKKPELLKPKQVAKPRDFNPYGYLKASELAWIAGVIDAAGHIATHKVVNTKRYGRLLTHRCIVRGGLRIGPTIIHLGEMLNIKPRDYSKNNSNPRYELVIPHQELDHLMKRLKPYLTLLKYNAYVKAKNDADLTTFKLIEQGWRMDGDTLTGPKATYKGVDFAAIDRYFEQNPTDPEKVAMQVQYLLNNIEE